MIPINSNTAVQEEFIILKEVYKNIHQLFIPFTNHSKDGIFVYLIKGKERNLLIDTALNADRCELDLRTQLKGLNVDLDKTDILLTHMHVDHSGLIGRLKNDNNIVYAGAKDKIYIDGYLEPPDQWPWLLPNNTWTGTPVELHARPNDHIACKYRPTGRIEVQPVDYGQVLKYDDYSFEIIDLAGHSAAHIGLWDKESGILFSGDHVLSDSFPNITTWNLNEDFFQYYLDNLAKLNNMQINHLFTAHDNPIDNIGLRIDSAITHYKNRLEHVKDALSKAARPMTAFEISSELKRHVSLAEVPPGTRWFICSDTLAYLQHLVLCGVASVSDCGGVRSFALI